MKYIYSDWIPDEVKFLTPNKRYKVLESFNDYKKDGTYQVTVEDDNGRQIGPINVGWPCAYLDDKLWSVEYDDETSS